MTATMPQTCAHCGLPLGASRTMLELEGQERLFCCSGCAFVYQLVGGGEHGESTASWFLVVLGFSAILSGFVMTFSWVLYLNPNLPSSTRDLLHYILLALATPVIFGVGYPYIRTALREIVRGQLSMSSLIALGTVTAYLYSAYLTFQHAPHVYFDTATMVIVLVTVGRFLQVRARARAAQAMRAFAIETPQQARRLRHGEEETVAVDELRVGDLIRALPGEKIAVDGRLREGRTTVDESLLTGESMPVPRQAGDFVFQGTINVDGAIIFEATQVGEGTLQAQVERLLAEAAAARMPLQSLVDRVSAGFVAITIVLTIGVALFYWGHGQPINGFLNALAVLVVACPCALGIATPMAAFVGLQRAAREGVLIRSTEVLEKLARVDCLVFDKTGTLTQGKLSVDEVRTTASAGITPERLLEIAASLESCSEHHLGQAIVEECKKRSGNLWPVTDFINHPGEGVEGKVAWNDTGEKAPVHVYLGTLASLQAGGFELPGDLETLSVRPGLETRAYIGWGDRIRGVIHLQDQLRPGAQEAVAQCKLLHLDLRILSGDRRETTERVASALGIANWASERRPAQKVEYIAELQGQGHRVAMVGDGINDAPALSKADVGLVHQVGADLSKEAADVHILGGELARVPWSVSLARKTFGHIRQNLFWAFFYNVIAMGMAAAGWLTPVMAAAAMLFSSLMVVGNSLRLGKAAGLPAGACATAGAGTASSWSPRAATAIGDPETPRADPASTS